MRKGETFREWKLILKGGRVNRGREERRTVRDGSKAERGDDLVGKRWERRWWRCAADGGVVPGAEAAMPCAKRVADLLCHVPSRCRLPRARILTWGTCGKGSDDEGEGFDCYEHFGIWERLRVEIKLLTASVDCLHAIPMCGELSTRSASSRVGRPLSARRDVQWQSWQVEFEMALLQREPYGVKSFSGVDWTVVT